MTSQSIPPTPNTKKSKGPHSFGHEKGKGTGVWRRHLRMSPWMTEDKTGLKLATYLEIASGYRVPRFFKNFPVPSPARLSHQTGSIAACARDAGHWQHRSLPRLLVVPMALVLEFTTSVTAVRNLYYITLVKWNVHHNVCVTQTLVKVAILGFYLLFITSTSVAAKL